ASAFEAVLSTMIRAWAIWRPLMRRSKVVDVNCSDGVCVRVDEIVTNIATKIATFTCSGSGCTNFKGVEASELSRRLSSPLHLSRGDEPGRAQLEGLSLQTGIRKGLIRKV